MCGARAEAEGLQAEAIAAVNERRIPRAFQEHLLGSVTALAAAIECIPPAPQADDDEDEDEEEDEDEDEDGKRKGKGKGKGKGKD